MAAHSLPLPPLKRGKNQKGRETFVGLDKKSLIRQQNNIKIEDKISDNAISHELPLHQTASPMERELIGTKAQRPTAKG